MRPFDIELTIAAAAVLVCTCNHNSCYCQFVLWLQVQYGDRAEHCWNGAEGDVPNAISRLRYN